MNRHRFEPARLLLGLMLMGAAVVYALDALGQWRVPVWALLVLVPASLVAAAFTAVATFAVRRLLRRRRTQGPGVPGRMPMDELRGGYGASATGGLQRDDGQKDDREHGGEQHGGQQHGGTRPFGGSGGGTGTD
ncbi:hypothetical protein [Streptomyces bathyalis]|uniref:hypothetical protein n=1 Tax=Streptomyces bathyalis TaxID=2710756 RepID=UPI0018D1325B|nr:hypothetical protein [Streptomyces bathyalis]